MIPYEVYAKLPYRLGTDEYSKRFEQALKSGEKPVEVNCFGTRNYKIIDSQHVKIQLDDGHWLTYEYVEYKDLCPVCGRLMLVRAIKGTTWLALCSDECYRKFDELMKKTGKQHTPHSPSSIFG